MNSRISLNILNYNTFDKSKTCIESCLNQTGGKYLILLIDNCSTDDSFFKLKEYFGEKINYLQNDDNYGFAKGNNIGIEYCKKKGIRYSLLLNSDTELVGSNLVFNLTKVMESYGDCAVVAPTIYDVTKKGRIMHSNDSLYLRMLRLGKVLPSNAIVSDNLELMSEAHGSALFVDNNTFMSVGGFPEHFFMYGEESYFAKKILWAGKRIYWYKDNDNYVLHHHDKSNRTDNWRLFLMGRNRGLEYFENRKKYFLWDMIYYTFFTYLFFSGKNKHKSYIDGMIQAKNLIKQGVSKTELYNQAKIIKDNYK